MKTPCRHNASLTQDCIPFQRAPFKSLKSWCNVKAAGLFGDKCFKNSKIFLFKCLKHQPERTETPPEPLKEKGTPLASCLCLLKGKSFRK